MRPRGDLRPRRQATRRGAHPLGGLTPRHPFLDHPGVIPFAHRGGAEAHPENTLAAFAAAVDLGYRYLETDVHVTVDGVLIAFHDDRLERVTDLRGRIAELPWSDVRAARVGGVEPIVRFEALLEAFPDARFNVEPKHDAAVTPLIRALREASAVDRVCVGSFSDRRVREVRRALGSAVCTSFGTMEVAAIRLAAWGLPGLRRLVARRPGLCLQVPQTALGLHLAEARLIEFAHDLGLPVHVWTINDEATMERLIDLGVDGLMTDRPSTLRTVLETRGAWVKPGPA